MLRGDQALLLGCHVLPKASFGRHTALPFDDLGSLRIALGAPDPAPPFLQREEFGLLFLPLPPQVYACASHAVFSPPAIQRLGDGVFNEVIVTNTIPVAPENIFPGLTILSVANLLGETIWRVYNASSVQELRD